MPTPVFQGRCRHAWQQIGVVGHSRPKDDNNQPPRLAMDRWLCTISAQALVLIHALHRLSLLHVVPEDVQHLLEHSFRPCTDASASYGIPTGQSDPEVPSLLALMHPNLNQGGHAEPGHQALEPQLLSTKSTSCGATKQLWCNERLQCHARQQERARPVCNCTSCCCPYPC